MSIATEITRINNNIASAYTACSNKGATMPATQNSANLATTIGTITTGGGGTPNLQDKSVTISSNGSQDVTADNGYDGLGTVSITTVVPPTQYVVAPASKFTLSSSNWVDDTYYLTISTSSYTIDSTKLQIGIPTDSSSTNTLNIANAGLTVFNYTSGNCVIKAVNAPTSNVSILLFGVEANS